MLKKSKQLSNNFEFMLPSNFKSYDYIYGYCTPEDSLLNSIACDMASTDHISRYFVFRKDIDSSKIIITTQRETSFICQDFKYNKYWLINAVFPVLSQRYKPYYSSQDMQILKEDTLAVISYLYNVKGRNPAIMCYNKHYWGVLNNIGIEFCYRKYTTTYDKNTIANLDKQSSYYLNYLAKQVIDRK